MTTSADCNLIERDKSFFLKEAGRRPTLDPALRPGTAAQKHAWCCLLVRHSLEISILVRHGHFIIIDQFLMRWMGQFKVHNQVDNFVSSKYYPPAVPAQAGQWQCTVSVSGR